MKIFDSHFHIETGMAKYNINALHKNVIFNSYESYIEYLPQIADTDKVTLIFDYRNHLEFIADVLAQKKINGLKIHSRIQKLSESDYPVLIDKLEYIQPQVPITIDAFYFGDDLDHQPSLKSIVSIAKKFPGIPIIVAHSGGIEVLKYFYHLRNLENIFFDLSLSLAYLKNTSAFLDFKNLLKMGDENKIIFGTDYPFINPGFQLDTFLEMAADLNFSETTIEKILFYNSFALFK